MNIYNWSNGKDTGWDRFVKKIGDKPVIFDEELVSTSVSNIENHLKYQGYYNSKVTDSINTKNKKTTVQYNITIGKQYTIDSTEYIIVHELRSSGDADFIRIGIDERNNRRSIIEQVIKCL